MSHYLDYLRQEDRKSLLNGVWLEPHTITLSGIDANGHAVSETIGVPANNTTVYSTHRYTSIGNPHYPKMDAQIRRKERACKRVRRQHRAAFRRRKRGLA